MDRVDLLRWQADVAYRRLVDRLAGLTDDEYHWEPVAGCWTVHPDDAGDWVVDYQFNPDPPPFTTIAWRLSHIADCKIIYHEYAFGKRELTFPDLPALPTVDGVRARLEEGQALLTAALDKLDERSLDDPVLTNWGDQWPAWRIFATMTDHDAIHGAEVGCLRDLYRDRPR